MESEFLCQHKSNFSHNFSNLASLNTVLTVCLFYWQFFLDKLKLYNIQNYVEFFVVACWITALLFGMAY